MKTLPEPQKVAPVVEFISQILTPDLLKLCGILRTTSLHWDLLASATKTYPFSIRSEIFRFHLCHQNDKVVFYASQGLGYLFLRWNHFT